MEGLISILYTSKRFETVRCSLPRGVSIARPLSTIITLLTHIKQFHWLETHDLSLQNVCNFVLFANPLF